MASDYQPKKYVDFIASAEGGQNSGVSPLLLQKNQVGFALNCSLRGGYLHPRPPIFKKNLDYGGDSVLQALVENGFYQGGGYYRPDYGTESLIAQISGHLIKFTENGNVWGVTDISVPGDFNSPTTSQIWMWQSEKWMIVQDGTTKLPIFFDGLTSRRSFGASALLATTAANFTTSNPAVIGSTILLTLTAPYTGQYNVPVIFDGEFYQPVNSSSLLVVLTNITDTPGKVIATGEKISVDPSFVGIQQRLSVGQNGVIAGATVVDLFLKDPVALNPGDALNYDGFANPYIAQGSSPSDPGTSQTLTASFVAGGFSDVGKRLEIGTIIKKQASSPSFDLATIAAPFTVPAQGSSVTVSLQQPYTGGDVQYVAINGNYYSLAIVPISGSGVNLTMVNLTDTNAGKLILAGAKIYSVPELPAGRMGAYGMGRNWMSLTDGISYIAGDIVGGAAGTPANNYRDAVLKTTENDFLSGGGSFRLPGAGDIITAMVFPPILDTSLGQGQLQIFTANSCFSNNSPVDRTKWAELTSPLQTESLKDNGALAQNSTILVNSDTFFRSPAGIGSLVLARRDFGGWGNKTISNEMQRPLNRDNQTLLSYGSAIAADNRFLSTCAPNVSAQGVFHIGIIALNFDLISSLRGDVPPSWEGVWTGINALQTIGGRVNGSKRSFAFSFNFDENKIELYEFLPEQTAEYLDNGVTPIVWVFETPILFNKEIKTANELIQLQTGEVYLSNIKGTVEVEVQYKPDFYPCWTTWRKFNVCSDLSGDNANPTYRMRVGLGEPDVSDCEIGNNRPLRVGFFFQCRVVITGSCVWHGVRLQATAQPQPSFAEVECESRDCQKIICVVPNDLRIFSLDGLPPEPLPPVISPPLTNSNEVVYFDNPCADGTTLVYSGILPTWITVDTTNERLVGAANTFWSATQDGANELAQAALDDFAETAIGNGKLVCFTCGTTPTTLAALVWTVVSDPLIPMVAAADTISWTNAYNAAILRSSYATANFCNPTSSPINIQAYFPGVGNPTYSTGTDPGAAYALITFNGQTMLRTDNLGNVTGPSSKTVIVPAYSTLALIVRYDQFYDYTAAGTVQLQIV